MAGLEWSEVRDDWFVDGGLRDIYVEGATTEDWQRVVDVLRDRGWPTKFSRDGEVASMPVTVEAIFELREEHSPMWQIRPHPEVAVNCHFFGPGRIEFDADPREIGGQERFDAVCEFITAVGRTLGKPVDVTVEGGEDAFMRYEPSTDRIVRVPPPPPISLLERLSGGG